MSEEELIDLLYNKFCNEDDDYDLRYTDIIYNSIEEKDKEIEKLNNDIKILLKENDNKEKVIIRLNNIINETIKYLEPFVEIDECVIKGRIIKPALVKLKEGKQ